MKYPIMLSFRMVVALVDIDNHYEDKDSPRWDSRTVVALERRLLIFPTKVLGGKARVPQFALTKKGKAYLHAALFEFQAAEREIAKAEHLKKKAKKAA